jgi:hypothetical protein
MKLMRNPNAWVFLLVTTGLAGAIRESLALMALDVVIALWTGRVMVKADMALFCDVCAEDIAKAKAAKAAQAKAAQSKRPAARKS